MMDRLNGRSTGPEDAAPDSPSFSPNPAGSSSPSPQFGRLSPTTSRRYGTGARRDELSDHESDASTSSRPHSPSPGDESLDGPPLVVPSALQDAISAFSNAGKRANGRRGGLADQGIGGASAAKDAKANAADRSQLLSEALNPNEYPDTPAFREVNEVLRKVSLEWPALARGTSVAAEDAGGEDFDPVSLALHLLDPASSRERGGDPSVGGRQQSLSSFLRLKAELDHAIQSTLSPVTNPSTTSSNAYRAYETSITTHNMTLGALGVAQKQIGGLKAGLMGTRDMLEGKGREGLAGMYARMGMLEEMSGVLDEMCVSPASLASHVAREPTDPFSLLSVEMQRSPAEVAPLARISPFRETVPVCGRAAREEYQDAEQTGNARDWCAG